MLEGLFGEVVESPGGDVGFELPVPGFGVEFDEPGSKGGEFWV
jgi:hypothetical protein